MEPIRYFNRHTRRIEIEQIYGEGFLRWTYNHPCGALARWAFITRPWFSAWYGRRMDRPASAAKVARFIERYGLDPAEFADPPDTFRSFNEFFFRKLKPCHRPIDTAADSVVFPADGRHLGFPQASAIDRVFVKGQKFDLTALLGDASLAARFADGALVLSRLCPVDYHRFHFPFAGVPGEPRLIEGPLFSVSPIALSRRLRYLWTNRRVVTRVETPTIGAIVLVEVGATCVGGIHQTYQPGRQVAKGDEKGYFSFGGSSMISIFEPGRIVLESDLLEHSSQGTELYANVGSRMGRLA